MKRLVVAALVVAAGFAVPVARAGEGVLVDSVPAGVGKPAAIGAARDALKYRDWKVEAEDADSVSATITRSGVDAKIRIRMAGSQLVYEESALGPIRVDFKGQRVPSVVATPSRWIEYLRSDTKERLQALAGPPAKPAASRGVERLAELKEMLDRGLISAEEYARKKDEILKAL